MTDNSIALRVAATLAFEELGLLYVGSAVDTPSALDALPAAVSVAFDGAHAGCLTLCVSDDVFRALAENMLGLEGEDAEPWRWDALGEMANVICGNALPYILGTHVRLTLAPPARGAPAVSRGASHIELEVETGRARILLDLAGERRQ
ncbi:MAG TPA: chemotaxis protein CheX [Gemmatimonadaceae bacterium]|nr:chemotaxis protein CheX [Gemmatimonadaceae bacterium]